MEDLQLINDFIKELYNNTIQIYFKNLKSSDKQILFKYYGYLVTIIYYAFFTDFKTLSEFSKSLYGRDTMCFSSVRPLLSL